MKAESGEEEFESEEGEELAMEEEEQANEEEEFKSEEEEEQANEEEEEANKGEEKVQEGEQENLAPSLRTRCEQQSLTMSLVRPNLSRFTVATIIRAFRQHNRGGRAAIFTAAQETLIVDMVRENNLIRLREIRDKVIADNVNFESIDDVSLATIDRVLRRQKMRMKRVVHRHAVLGSYNTQRLLTFLEELRDILLGPHITF
ncbi:hypothetical protein M9458_057353, partial [Cirrhinus mrigala]